MATTTKTKASKPDHATKHLSESALEFYNRVIEDYELDQHHIRLLIKACEAFDRAEQARKAILKFGLTYNDRYGAPKARPEVAIERDSRIAFARLGLM
jgi:hypothetical protein